MVGERCVQSTRIYEGKVVSLRVDTVEFTDGRRSTREVVEHRGAVAIVPVLDNGDILLVRQYRYAVGASLLEVPAGTLDGGEEPLACADRELQEEIGYRAARFERLGGFYVAPGYDTEYIHAFLATGLTASRLASDEDEEIETVPLPLAEALAMIEGGEIIDAKSICALLLYARRR